MRALAFVIAAVLVQGCVAYNNTCEAPVENAGKTVAVIPSGQAIYMDKPNARHANNAFGEATADALTDAFSGTSSPAQMGIINAGDLRAEGFCSPITTLKSKITISEVHEILLFDNVVFALDVDEPRVVAALEHSVEALTPTVVNVGTNVPISAPPARFLQVSSAVHMTVNCWNPAGSRITSLKIGETTIDPRAPDVSRKWRVAMSSYLVNGGDGYQMFPDALNDASFDANLQQATQAHPTEAYLTASYMLGHYKNDDHPDLPPITTDPRIDFSIDMGGTRVQTCATPVPPSG